MLLETSEGGPKERLVLTFINALKDDLAHNLGDASQVFTLHGYCQHLLHREEKLRNGLTETFRCYPGLISLIKRDWEWLRKSGAPRFAELMRDLKCSDAQITFYLERSNYYDAVDFDDSVHRTYQQLAANPDVIPEYKLVLIDEFQDFNRMEASVIDLLARPNSIVIAGDDDQALYSQLRGASWDHIRAHYASGQYEIFELPFCMRCPEVIVAAVNDIIVKARADQRLNGRIDKPYRYYEPKKAEDSRRFPFIEMTETSVQRENANYFGRYIAQCIRSISEDEIQQAADKNEPVALIIGSNPYRRQVEKHLLETGLLEAVDKAELSDREIALQILNEDAESNLGWRIILACGGDGTARGVVCKAAEQNVSLATLIPAADREPILKEAETWASEVAAREKSKDRSDTVQPVAITSYEGAKGRSAQYVFLLGLQSGDLPRNATDIKDIEICRFLVGLTRTKKRCSILVTKRFGNQLKRRSEFLSWIDPSRYIHKRIDAAYWKKA